MKLDMMNLVRENGKWRSYTHGRLWLCMNRARDPKYPATEVGNFDIHQLGLQDTGPTPENMIYSNLEPIAAQAVLYHLLSEVTEDTQESG